MIETRVNDPWMFDVRQGNGRRYFVAQQRYYLYEEKARNPSVDATSYLDHFCWQMYREDESNPLFVFLVDAKTSSCSSILPAITILMKSLFE